MAVPVATIVRHALTGLSVISPTEPVRPNDAADVLDALNTILDDWNALGEASIAEVYSSFVTIAALQPHTIGPTGVWVLPVRPVTIDGLAWLTAAGIYTPITVHTDPRWWNTAVVIATGLLTDAYYSADLPDGSLYFTTLAGGTTVRVMTRTVLSAVTLTQSLTLAPGYQSALELTLMEAVADLFHVTLTASQITRAGKARARIFANNLRVPALSTEGLGLPGPSRGRWWDYRTGTWR